LGYKNSDTFAYDKELNRYQYGKYGQSEAAIQ
jgi:hypothetical protein